MRRIPPFFLAATFAWVFAQRDAIATIGKGTEQFGQLLVAFCNQGLKKAIGLQLLRGTNREFATEYMWWFFLIQAYPLPEHLIGLDPKFYLQHVFEGLNKTPGAVGPNEMKEYEQAFSNPTEIHATGEDFRAAADIDLELDAVDDKAGRKDPMSTSCPVGLKGDSRRLVGRAR